MINPYLSWIYLIWTCFTSNQLFFFFFLPLQLHHLLTFPSIRKSQIRGFTKEEHTTDTPHQWLTSLTEQSRTWSCLLTSFMVLFGDLQSMETLTDSQPGWAPYHLERASSLFTFMLRLLLVLQSQVTNSPKEKWSSGLFVHKLGVVDVTIVQRILGVESSFFFLLLLELIVLYIWVDDDRAVGEETL